MKHKQVKPPVWKPVEVQIAELTEKRTACAILLDNIDAQLKQLPHDRAAARLLLGQCDAAITQLWKEEAEEGRGPYAEQA